MAAIPKKVTVSVDIDFLSDAVFRAKLVFFLPLLVVFLFSAYLFTRADFHVFNLVEFSRLAINFQKLYSIAFLFFIVTYGLALGLAVFYGFRQRAVPVALSSLALVIGGAVLGAFFPNYLVSLVILALATGATMYFASRLERLSLGTGWSAAGKGLIAFVLLGFLFVGLVGQANRDAYFDMALSQLATTAVPALGATSAPTTALEGLTISEESVRAGFPKEAFVEIYTKNLPLHLKSETTVLAAADSAYEESIALITVGINNFKGQLVQYLQQQPAGAPQLTPAQLSAAKAAFQRNPNLALVFENFGWVLAFVALTLIYAVKLFVQLFAAAFTWALSKL